jgi:hypothetical protein
VHPQPSRVWGPPGDALAQRTCAARLPQMCCNRRGNHRQFA